MKIDKKYVMIVTAEDERYGTAGYGLDFFANSPAEGILNDIAYGFFLWGIQLNDFYFCFIE